MALAGKADSRRPYAVPALQSAIFMGRKNKKSSFINKKDARTFTLVEPTQEEIDAGAKGPIFKETTKGKFRGHRNDKELDACFFGNKKTVQPASIAPIDSSVARKYGVEFEDIDEYDYMKHMQAIREDSSSIILEAPGLAKKRSEEQLEAATNIDVLEVMGALDDDAYIDSTLDEKRFLSLMGVDTTKTDRCSASTLTLNDQPFSSNTSKNTLIKDIDREFDKIFEEYEDFEDSEDTSTEKKQSDEFCSLFSADDLLDDIDQYL